jgi:hypothetical protein
MVEASLAVAVYLALLGVSGTMYFRAAEDQVEGRLTWGLLPE